MRAVELVHFRRRSGEQSSPPRGSQHRAGHEGKGEENPASALPLRCPCLTRKQVLWLALMLAVGGAIIAVGLILGLAVNFGGSGEAKSASTKPTEAAQVTRESTGVVYSVTGSTTMIGTTGRPLRASKFCLHTAIIKVTCCCDSSSAKSVQSSKSVQSFPRWCNLPSRLTPVCEVIRYHVVQA